MTSIVKNQDGISAIIVIVVMLGLILSLGLAVSKSSINELALSLDEDSSSQALHAADACAEEASLRLKRNSGYTGGSLTFNNGDCTVVVSGGGSTRTMTVTATVGSETRDVTVDVTLEQNVDMTSDGIDVTNWE